MMYALKTTSIFTRARAQLRCLSSFSLSTKNTTSRGAASGLTHVATNNNRSGDAKFALPEYPMTYDRSLFEFPTTTQIVQASGDMELLPSQRVIGHQVPDDANNNLEAVIQAMNRNARRPKKANKGSRPCSRAGRRKRKEKIGKRSR